MKLREQLRAARIKYSGGVEVAEDDPLAKDKKKLPIRSRSRAHTG